MLKLYGFPVSNYTNMVELALLEKGLPFEYVLTFPEQTPEFLARSPRGKVPEAIKSKAREDLLAGFATLKRHARFAPYVAGESFTLADIVFLYSVDLAATVGKQLFDLDPLADIPGARSLQQRLGENPHVRTIAAKREAGLPAFVSAVRARLQGGS
jgi:glutathione S-transferase